MIVFDGQNILDVCLQEYGRLDELFSEILIPNNLSVNAVLQGGQNISTNPLGKGNETIKDLIKVNGYIIMNGGVVENPNIVTEIALQWPVYVNPTISINANKIIQ
jgi:hypothetical protein